MKPYQLGIYEKAMPNTLTWKEKLTYTKEFGFDYLEMSIDETDEKLSRLHMPLGERRALRNLLMDTGVPIQSICLSGHRKYPMGSKDCNIRKQAMDIMEKAVLLSSDLGVRIIQLAGYDVYYEQSDEETKARFEENLAKACEMAATYGVAMGFETMEATHNPFMDTVKKAMDYVQKMNTPYLGVYPDIGNLQNASLCYKVPVETDLKKGAGHILAAHLKETLPGIYREVPFSTGHTEYETALRILKEQKVRLFVGEFWYVGQAQWKEDCQNANLFLRKKLDSVFHVCTI